MEKCNFSTAQKLRDVGVSVPRRHLGLHTRSSKLTVDELLVELEEWDSDVQIKEYKGISGKPIMYRVECTVFGGYRAVANARRVADALGLVLYRIQLDKGGRAMHDDDVDAIISEQGYEEERKREVIEAAEVEEDNSRKRTRSSGGRRTKVAKDEQGDDRKDSRGSVQREDIH